MTGEAHGPNGGALLTVAATEQDGIVVVSLAGELDMSSAGTAAIALRDATTGAPSVVVDMTGLRFFASAGLNVLLQLRRELQDRGVRVWLAADQRAVLRPLELMGVADQFEIRTTVTEAVAAARAGTDPLAG
jgi:anti-anti-sigma factor